MKGMRWMERPSSNIPKTNQWRCPPGTWKGMFILKAQTLTSLAILTEIVTEAVRVDQLTKKKKRWQERKRRRRKGGEGREPCSTSPVNKRKTPGQMDTAFRGCVATLKSKEAAPLCSWVGGSDNCFENQSINKSLWVVTEHRPCFQFNWVCLALPTRGLGICSVQTGWLPPFRKWLEQPARPASHPFPQFSSSALHFKPMLGDGILCGPRHTWHHLVALTFW